MSGFALRLTAHNEKTIVNNLNKRNMKKTIFTVMAAAALCSCANNNFTLSGQLPEGYDSVYLHLPWVEEGSQLAAAAVDAEGNFVLKGKVENPTLLTFTTDENQEPLATYLFVEKGGNYTLRFEEGNKGWPVTGSPANEAMAAYQQAMQELQGFYMLAETEEEQLAVANRADSLIEASVNNNKENLFSAYLIAAQYAGMPVAELRELVASLSPEVQASNIVAEINKSIDAKAATEVGQPYIELNLENPEGQMVALSSLIGEGKWVLIDFWATWCGPCKQEIPHLVEAYKELHDKGFEIYGVSLDHDPAAWKAFLPAHEMTWVNVIGTRSEQIKAYAVQSIPSNFLISPEGKIVATQLRGEGVMETLKEFIK